MTDYSELLDEGRVKQGRFARRQVEDRLRIAQRDVETAQSVIESSPEWVFNIAYNAMHQAGRAFMLSPKSPSGWDMPKTRATSEES